MSRFYVEDYELSREQLDGKYNPEGDGQHPGYTRRDWRSAVAQEDTISGYWAWVWHMLDIEQMELDKDSPFNYLKGN